MQIWGTYVWQLGLAFLIGVFDEAILAYFYIIISQNKKFQSFILASFITFFNLWVYVMITRVVAIENQLDLIISYALGTGAGAITTIAMQSKGQRKKFRQAIRRTLRLRRRAANAERKVPGLVTTFAQSVKLEITKSKVEKMIPTSPNPPQVPPLRLITFSDGADVKNAA